MTWLALVVAVSTLFGWVPWPAELVPAAKWISVAALVIDASRVVAAVLARVIDR